MRQQKAKLQGRRGFTLILMTFMLTILIGAAAFGVDFGRMYMYRAQLHTAADAAALAAAQRIMVGDTVLVAAVAPPAETAYVYSAKHTVGGAAIGRAATDVIPGTWSAGGGFVPNGGDWSTANAVQDTTRYTATFIFGKLFGYNTRVIRASSDAVVGYVGASTCIMPMAVPYQAMLDQLYPPAGTQSTSYDLTPTDVLNLARATQANEVLLKAGDASSSPVNGSFYLLQMGPFAHADGIPLSPGPSTLNNNQFGDLFNAAGNNCTARTTDWSIGPGDWLQGKQGNASGPMANAFEKLCQLPNNTIQGNNNTWVCPAPLARRTVKVVMWATQGQPGGCTPRCYQVKYAGVFVVTKYSTFSGGTEDGLWGYFSSMAAEGTFSTTPSPLKKLALVR